MSRRAIAAWLRTRGWGQASADSFLAPRPCSSSSPSVLLRARGEPPAALSSCASNSPKEARATLIPVALDPWRRRAPGSSAFSSASASHDRASYTRQHDDADDQRRRKHLLLQQKGDLQVEPPEEEHEDDDDRGDAAAARSLPSPTADSASGLNNGGGSGNSGNSSSTSTNSSSTTNSNSSSTNSNSSSRRRDMAIAYTCGKCGAREVKAFTRAAYERGVVIVQCGGCEARHLVADNLGWFPREGAGEEGDGGLGAGEGEGGRGGRASEADEQGGEGDAAASSPGGRRRQRREGGASGGSGSWRIEDLADEGRGDVRRMTLDAAVRAEVDLAEAEAAAAADKADNSRGGG